MSKSTGRYSYLGMTNSEYVSAHTWVHRTYGKADRCDVCGREDAKRYEWSNISKRYRRDRADWKMMCTTCHRKADYTERQKRLSSMRRSKPVSQYTLDGELVRSYPSTVAAHRSTGISLTALFNNLMGRSKTAGGFVWKR